ncbi:MAG: 6-carboxytetrahydropterin synthase [Verrucomicrobiota bacterium]
MPFRIARIFEIENGHMLSKHPDKCRFPHGHSRRIECTIEAPDLDDREMVCDFKVLKLILSDYLDQFDHAMFMNTNDPAYSEFKERYGDRIIGLECQDPTTEVIAQKIHHHLKNSLKSYQKKASSDFPLRDSVRIANVRVWETSSSWAEYSE